MDPPPDTDALVPGAPQHHSPIQNLDPTLRLDPSSAPPPAPRSFSGARIKVPNYSPSRRPLGGVSFGPLPSPGEYLEIPRGGLGQVRQEHLADSDPPSHRKSIFSDSPHPYSGRSGLPSSPPTLPSSQPPGPQAAATTAGLFPSQKLPSAQGAPSYLSRSSPHTYLRGAGSPWPCPVSPATP